MKEKLREFLLQRIANLKAFLREGRKAMTNSDEDEDEITVEITEYGWEPNPEIFLANESEESYQLRLRSEREHLIAKGYTPEEAEKMAQERVINYRKLYRKDESNDVKESSWNPISPEILFANESEDSYQWRLRSEREHLIAKGYTPEKAEKMATEKVIDYRKLYGKNEKGNDGEER